MEFITGIPYTRLPSALPIPSNAASGVLDLGLLDNKCLIKSGSAAAHITANARKWSMNNPPYVFLRAVGPKDSAAGSPASPKQEILFLLALSQVKFLL